MISVTSALSLVSDKSWLSRARGHWERKHGEGSWDRYVGGAATLGTYAHYAFGCDLADASDLPYPEFEPNEQLPADRLEDYEDILSYWQDFCGIARPRIYEVGLEQFVWHSSGYAGRVDSVMVLDNQSIRDAIPFYADNFLIRGGPDSLRHDDVWLVDFKTSKSIYDTYPAQLWAYKEAYNERTRGAPVNRMAILRIHSNQQTWGNSTGWEFYESPGDPWTWEKAMDAAVAKGLIQ
jgi:hypothetical protein